MNEPKKKELEAAARAKFPDAVAFHINHRKHTLRVVWSMRSGDELLIISTSHRELLKQIQNYKPPQQLVA